MVLPPFTPSRSLVGCLLNIVPAHYREAHWSEKAVPLAGRSHNRNNIAHLTLFCEMTRVRAARGLVCTSTSIKGDQATPVLGSKLRGNPDLTSEGGRGHPPNTPQPSLKESNQRGRKGEAKKDS